MREGVEWLSATQLGVFKCTARSSSSLSAATWLSSGPLWCGLKGTLDPSKDASSAVSFSSVFVSFPSVSATLSLSAVSLASPSEYTSRRRRRRAPFVRMSCSEHNHRCVHKCIARLEFYTDKYAHCLPLQMHVLQSGHHCSDVKNKTKIK